MSYPLQTLEFSKLPLSDISRSWSFTNARCSNKRPLFIFPIFEFSRLWNFKVAKFQRFTASRSQSSKIAKFHSEVSKFRSFTLSPCRSSEDSKCTKCQCLEIYKCQHLQNNQKCRMPSFPWNGAHRSRNLQFMRMSIFRELFCRKSIGACSWNTYSNYT